MKYKRFISLLLAVLFTAVIFTGCSASSGSKKVIFIPQAESNGAFWDDINSKLKAESEKEGYEYKRMAAKEWGASQQEEIIEQAVNEKPSTIIIAPCGTSELFSAIKKANEAGIAVILVDTDIDNEHLKSYGADVTAFVGIDNYKCGQQVADLVCEKIPAGSEFAVFSGGVDSPNGERRCDGFSDEAEKKGMKLDARVTTEWTADDAYIKAKDILKAYPDLKAVFTVNSTIYSGVKKAADEYNISFYAGTFDVDDDILKNIEQGNVVCTLDQNSSEMAKKLVQQINKIRAGEKIDRVIYSEGKMISKN